MPTKVSTEDFISAWKIAGSPKLVADMLGLSTRAAMGRRQRLMQLGHHLPSFNAKAACGGINAEKHKRNLKLAAVRAKYLQKEIHLPIKNGIVIVFSDAHYWPGEPTVAHRALLAICKQHKPKLVIANGDIFDGAAISRHPRAGFEHRPKVREEIDAVCTRMREIEKAAGRAQLIRTIGNHDMRFESYISSNAPELENVTGTSLFDYLPKWDGCFALHLNQKTDGHTVIRHKHVAGGVHSAYNSTLRSGCHYVHGHLHKLQVIPFGDYRGRRYGVDTGCLADPHSEQFSYTEAGPLNWCSGFALLTYVNGKLLIPELCEVIDGVAWFRGERVEIG